VAEEDVELFCSPVKLKDDTSNTARLNGQPRSNVGIKGVKGWVLKLFDVLERCCISKA
jgi:hypothetical protein